MNAKHPNWFRSRKIVSASYSGSMTLSEFSMPTDPIPGTPFNAVNDNDKADEGSGPAPCPGRLTPPLTPEWRSRQRENESTGFCQ
jgi:hypothetical protein